MTEVRVIGKVKAGTLLVWCACGRGNAIAALDSRGRPRRFARGHRSKA